MPPGDGLGDAELINFRALAHFWRLMVRSARQQKGVVFGLFALVVALAAIALVVLPKTYHVETRLLAERNQVLAIRGDQPGSDPSRAAAETVLRQDALVDLIRATRLLEEWPKRRAPILRLKDHIMALVAREPTHEERLNALIGYLRVRLGVWNNQGTVTIQIDWPDAQMAFSLVDAAQRAFLEARHVQDVSTIAEASAILEGHASDARHEIDTAVEELKTLLERKRGEKEKSGSAGREAHGAEPPRAPSPAARPSPPPASDSAAGLADAAKAERRLSELSVVIEAKTRTVRDLEDFRQRRLAELSGQLNEKRAVYTEAHPAIADIKQAIAGVSEESPQVSRLRTELKALQTEHDSLHGMDATAAARGRPTGGGSGSALPRGALPGEVIRIEQESAEERDPEVEYARARLQFAIQNFQQLQGKIDASRVDLETAEAAFKYRYTVIAPAEVPRGPTKPKGSLVMIAAALGGLLLGVFAAVGVELRRGVLQERWQVEDTLALPVLGEIRLLPTTSEKRS